VRCGIRVASEITGLECPPIKRLWRRASGLCGPAADGRDRRWVRRPAPYAACQNFYRNWAGPRVARWVDGEDGTPCGCRLSPGDDLRP
jgi:hypothetical protein